MLTWLIQVNSLCRSISEKAVQAKQFLNEKQRDAALAVNGYMKADYDKLDELLLSADPERAFRGRMGDLARHISFGHAGDYDDIVTFDIPAVQEAAEDLALHRTVQVPNLGFEALLHPAVIESSLNQYRNGHLRDAVLNGVIAVFDMIRARTGIEGDGSHLVGQAFGAENGKLIFSDLDSESGKNDQKGFMQIYSGIYAGVRNVKAHTLGHDLDEHKAAQYLVMCSLLARRVDECKDRQ
jgi:uncharacterized protein (TIGR02391 family)